MTCHDLHSYLASRSRAAFSASGQSAEISQHIRGCHACRQSIELADDLARRLQLVCDAAPEFPAALDAAILADYRQHIQKSNVPAVALPLREPINRPPGLLWRVAAAAVLLVPMLLHFADRRMAPPPKPPAAQSQPLIATPTVHAENPIIAHSPSPIHPGKIVRLHWRRTRHQLPLTWLPAGHCPQDS